MTAPKSGLRELSEAGKRMRARFIAEAVSKYGAPTLVRWMEDDAKRRIINAACEELALTAKEVPHA